MISIHAPETNPALLARDWYCPWGPTPSDWALGQIHRAPEPTLQELGSLICRYPWTPALYRGGLRRQTHFIRSQLIVLDYDEGTTIAEAQQKFARYRHIIGTTRSHQKMKGNEPPCDRFRVLLFMLAPLFSVTRYRNMYQQYVDYAGCDFHVKDAARLFFPCKEIISINNGFSIPYRFGPEDEEKKKTKTETSQIVPEHCVENKGEPFTRKKRHRWAGMEAWRQNSFNEGQRNSCCFRAACDCFEQGMTYYQTESWIMEVGTSLPHNEVCTTIRSAQKKKNGV